MKPRTGLEAADRTAANTPATTLGRALRQARRFGAILVWPVLIGVLLWPTQFGGASTFVIVVGHSMEPTLHTGDLAYARRFGTVDVGTLVVYEVPDGPAAGKLVIHRIVGGDANGYVTQGDNNPSPDPWRPTFDDIDGTVLFHVPMAGRPIQVLAQPLVVAAIAALLTVLLLWPGDTSEDADSEPDEIPGLDTRATSAKAKRPSVLHRFVLHRLWRRKPQG